MKPFLKLIASCSAAALSLAGSVSADEKSGTLDVYWVDVEGGAGTLIVTPAGETILIDTGMPGGRDPGRIHRTATEIAGRTQIDHLVTTHFHLDHFGGAAEIAQKMPIHHVWDNGVPDKNPDGNPNDTRFPIMIKPYKEMAARERHVIAPDVELPLRQSGSTPFSIRCVAAMEKVSSRVVREPGVVDCASVPAKTPDTSDNRNSVALLVSFGDFRFFVGGDMTWNTEATLVCPVDRVGVVDVFQVTHHGLDQSNNPLLVRSLAPTVSVMSNGTTKGCGAETFATLKGTDSVEAMYQIHRNLRADSENNTAAEYIANHEKECAANHIQMSVAPDGKTYSLAIPATGHSRQFSTRAK
ncbi:MAG TPA: hypothetical protein DCY13_08490 [Verrucomicrobiales bacterium]|nr:hypothetical protein [Verrucomicrobiales bacterium]